MANPVYLRGSKRAALTGQTFQFDPTRGETVISRYHSIDYNTMIALANQYAFDGVAYNLDLTQGIARLTANDATLNNPIDTWEILGNDERKDLFQNPLWGNAISDAQMSAILQHLENNDTPAIAFGDPALAALANGVVQRAYARYQAGNQEFENDAYGGGYVLKHTTNVPARWTVNVADFNIGAVYSTAKLISEITNSLLWIYPCPLRLVYKINNIPVPTLREYFQWGWKKSRSDESTVANNRVNITQHYVLEQWSTDDYAAFV